MATPFPPPCLQQQRAQGCPQTLQTVPCLLSHLQPFPSQAFRLVTPYPLLRKVLWTFAHPSTIVAGDLHWSQAEPQPPSSLWGRIQSFSKEGKPGSHGGSPAHTSCEHCKPISSSQLPTTHESFKATPNTWWTSHTTSVDQKLDPLRRGLAQLSVLWDLEPLGLLTLLLS